MSSERRCQGTTADGSRCGAPARLVDPSTGYCASHDPDRREAIREAGRRGGKATAKRYQQAGLGPDDLPPLVDHDAAEIWTDRIGRAAATGGVGANAANAALRAVKEWREAHVSRRLERLTDALSQWRKTGDPEPVLEMVEGGS